MTSPSPGWRRALAGAALGALLAGDASAAIIEGRITHPERPEAITDVPVQAIGIASDPNAGPITRETRSDARGRFVFDDLPSPAAYLIRAVYGGIAFPGGTAVFRPGEPESAPPMSIRVYDRSDDASQLSIASQQWVIEREAGVYRMDTNLVIRNAGTEVVAIDPNATAGLVIPLPSGRGAIESPFGRLPEGVTESERGLEIRGPILPGEAGLDFSLAFEMVPGEDAVLQTTLETGAPVESLRVYVRDFGVDVDAEGLHPARPARQNDVFYLSYVGFDLPAGSQHALRVKPLPPHRGLPEWAVAGLVAVLAGVLLFAVGRPVAEAAPGVAPLEPEDDEMRHGQALAAALVDLEHDFETGKLSQADRDSLRNELRGEAARALARERGLRAPAAKADAPAAERICACGRKAASEDRFCGSCGQPLPDAS